MTTNTSLALLAEPFPAEDIEWRLQQAGEKNGKPWAMCLAYVTNRAIMQRLDDVVGPANWRNEYAVGPGGGILCGLSLYLPNGMDGLHWVTKWDGAENTDVEAVKGGLSGAMKRAAVQWGIGRYLYDLEEGWAQISERGRFRGKTKSGASFRWDPPALPAWALPNGKPAAPSPRKTAVADAEPTPSLPASSEPGDQIMPMGDFQGTPLRDVPSDNLKRALKHFKTKDPLMAADIAAVLASREPVEVAA